MEDDRFWGIVESSKGNGTPDDQATRLQEALVLHPADEIAEFQQSLESHREQLYFGDLWAAGMLLNAGHATDVDFLFFRNWVISHGQLAYDGALEDPDSLADENISPQGNGHPRAVAEQFGYAAASAYRELTGHDLSQDLIDQPDDLLPEDDFDWEVYTHEVLADRLPRLWKKYGDKIRHYPHTWPAVDNSRVEIDGLGTLCIGDRLCHRKFGSGRILQFTNRGRMITGLFEFEDGRRPLVLDRKYFE